MIKKMAKGGLSTAEGRGKPKDLEMARVDRRMAEIDKYLKDPDLELVRTPNGFQFREKRKPTPAAPTPKIPKPSPKTVASASTTYKPYRGKGGSSSSNALPLSEFSSSGKRQAARPLDASMKRSTPLPRDMTGVNQTPIRGRDIAGAVAKGGVEGLMMGVGPGALGAGKALLGKGVDNALLAAASKPLTRGRMSNVIARARPGETVPPSSIVTPRFKSDRANRLRDMPPRLSDTAKEKLAKGEITKDEAIRMTLGFKRGFKRGGTAKAKPAKVATVMREFKSGKLHSGKSKKIVKNRKQAVAIALSEGRKARRT